MPIVPVVAPAQEARYDIHIESGLLSRCAPLLAAWAGRRAAVVADEHTAPLYGSTLLDQLNQAGVRASLITLPAGETTKSQAQLSRLYDEFLALHLTRADLVVALGGGFCHVPAADVRSQLFHQRHMRFRAVLAGGQDQVRTLKHGFKGVLHPGKLGPRHGMAADKVHPFGKDPGPLHDGGLDPAHIGDQAARLEILAHSHICRA